MSLEITLYSEKATKLKLVNFLKKEGFIKCEHMLSSFNNNNYLHYKWFEDMDYKSIDGVEASVIFNNEIDEKIKKKYQWILNTRTRGSASKEDKEKQNQVIKKAKNLFGGYFENDSYGKNKYTNLNDYPSYTPLEKGLYLMYENINEKISKVSYYLDAPDEFENNHKTTSDKNLREFILQQNPRRVIYNALLPLLVSLIEYLLSNTFILLLKYNQDAFSKLNEENIKIPIKEVIKISNSELHITDLIASNINFQNLCYSNKEYQKYFGIDLNTILHKKITVNKESVFLKTEIEKIIKNRHAMIHELSFDYSYCKNDLMNDINSINLFVSSLLDFLLEKKYINNKINN